MKFRIQNLEFRIGGFGGFTLIELTIVMAIIALLAGIGASNFTSSQTKGRDAKRRGDLTAVSRGLEVYYNDYGKYPQSATGLIKKCGLTGGDDCSWGTGPMQDSKGSIYIQSLPEDPKENSYTYFYWSNDVSYKLYAYLESLETGITPSELTADCDPDAVVDLECNYGVASPNAVP